MKGTTNIATNPSTTIVSAALLVLAVAGFGLGPVRAQEADSENSTAVERQCRPEGDDPLEGLTIPELYEQLQEIERNGGTIVDPSWFDPGPSLEPSSPEQEWEGQQRLREWERQEQELREFMEPREQHVPDETYPSPDDVEPTWERVPDWAEPNLGVNDTSDDGVEVATSDDPASIDPSDDPFGGSDLEPAGESDTSPDVDSGSEPDSDGGADVDSGGGNDTGGSDGDADDGGGSDGPGGGDVGSDGDGA